MLTNNRFMWGEPYGHSCLFDSLSNTIRCFTGEWPESSFFFDGQSEHIRKTKFVANLYPNVSCLQDAYLAFFDRLFAQPARDAGAESWGVKEVRLSAEHACFLRWLYPQAKLIFLIRNPYDAFRSFAARRAVGWNWYHRWPDRPLTANEFGKHWKRLSSSFLQHAESLDAHVIKYESLDAGEYGELEAYLGTELSKAATESRPNDGPKPIDHIDSNELRLLRSEVEDTALLFGYEYESPKKPVSDTRRSPPRKNPNSTCAILVPVGSHIEPKCEESLIALERRGYAVRRVRGYSAIDQARNQIASNAIADGFEETLWIDSDIDFSPDDVDRLRAHGEPIICALYPKKGKRELASHVLPGTKSLQFGAKGGLTEILYAGTGFLSVKREVYQRIQEQLDLPLCNEMFGRPIFPYFQPMIRSHQDGSWYLAEDYSFCERARSVGYQIIADTTIRLSHIGSYGFSWEDAGSSPTRFSSYNFKINGADQHQVKAESTASRAAGRRIEMTEPLTRLSRQYPWPAKRPNIIPQPRAGWLHDSVRKILADFLSPETNLVVELGAWAGLSTRFISDQAKNAVVVTVDHWLGNPPQRERPELAQTLKNLRELFYTNCWNYRGQIIAIDGETADGLRTVCDLGLEPNLVFIDADHAFDSVVNELTASIRYFANAQIVGDDWDRTSVQQAVKKVCDETGAQYGAMDSAWWIERDLTGRK